MNRLLVLMMVAALFGHGAPQTLSPEEHGNSTDCASENQTIIPTGRILSEPLKYFSIVFPEALLGTRQLCPSGSIDVTFDIPNTQEYYSPVKGVTCSDNPGIVEQFNRGYIYCHMTLHYGTNFPGYNAKDWDGVVKPYYEAMRNCNVNQCTGLVCNNSFELCWLKIKSPVEVGKAPISVSDRNFWNTVCSLKE